MIHIEIDMSSPIASEEGDVLGAARALTATLGEHFTEAGIIVHRLTVEEADA